MKTISAGCENKVKQIRCKGPRCKSFVPTFLHTLPVTPSRRASHLLQSRRPLSTLHAYRSNLPIVELLFSFLLCPLLGSPMLRGFPWHPPGTAYAVPPGMHSSLGAYMLGPTPVSTPSSFLSPFPCSPLLCPVLAAAIPHP